MGLHDTPGVARYRARVRSLIFYAGALRRVADELLREAPAAA